MDAMSSLVSQPSQISEFQVSWGPCSKKLIHSTTEEDSDNDFTPPDRYMCTWRAYTHTHTLSSLSSSSSQHENKELMKVMTGPGTST